MKSTQHTASKILSALGLILAGCSSVPEIPDKTPCTGFIKAAAGTKQPCRAEPINKPVKRQEV